MLASKRQTRQGSEVDCILFRTSAEIPAHVPFFKVKIFSSTFTNLTDLYLQVGEDLHTDHSERTFERVKGQALTDRPLRLALIPQVITYSNLMTKLDEAEKNIKAEEEARLAAMELANQGRAAPDTATLEVSSSRFAKRRRLGGQKDEGLDGAEGPAGGKVKKKLKGKVGSGKRSGLKMLPRNQGAARGSSSDVLSLGVAGLRGGSISGSVIGGTRELSTPIKQHDNKSGVGGYASPSSAFCGASPVAMDPSDPGHTDPVLLKLLTSNHGKVHPTIYQILRGMSIKREIGGAFSKGYTPPQSSGPQ